MTATPQKFCADCHDGMQGRLKTAGHPTTLADASDFGTRHPEFRPLVRPAAGGKLVRTTLAKGVVDYNGLKFPHDVHLRATGGVARMAAIFRGRYAFGKKPECANCHRVEADGVRVKPVSMERDCAMRSEEHTSEIQSLMRISYAVFCWNKNRKYKLQIK